MNRHGITIDLTAFGARAWRGFFPAIISTAAALVVSLSCSLPASAEPFDCGHRQCGLLTREGNPDIVIGVVEAVASPKQMNTVFHWARSHGYWQKVPADGHEYLDFTQLLSVSVPSASGAKSVSVLMTREEYNAGPLKPGALVRYAPHESFGNSAAYRNAITHKDPVKESYWWVLGCVAQLCSPQDTSCRSRYRQGRFSWHTGHQLQLNTGDVLPHGLVIDPMTLLPKTPEPNHS